MSKKIQVGDKAYHKGNLGIQVITCERVTEKTAFWSHGLRCKIDDRNVYEKGTGRNRNYTIPQTDQEEKRYADKLQLQQLKAEALSVHNSKFKNLNAGQLQKVIDLYKSFEHGQ